MSGKHYTVEKQKEAVKALALNGMDLQLTSKQLKVARTSLQRWAEKYPEIVQSGRKEVTEKMLKKGDDSQSSFIDKVMKGKEVAINRIIELVPKEKSIYTLLSVIEKLNEVTEGKGMSENTNSIYLQINQQLNQNNEN